MTVSEENAIDLLLLGTDVDSKTLKEGASKIIAEKYFEMKDQDEFKLVKQNDAAVDAIFSHFAGKVDDLNKSLATFRSTEMIICVKIKLICAGMILIVLLIVIFHNFRYKKTSTTQFEDCYPKVYGSSNCEFHS